jgi:hypothetical protein
MVRKAQPPSFPFVRLTFTQPFRKTDVIMYVCPYVITWTAGDHRSDMRLAVVPGIRTKSKSDVEPLKLNTMRKTTFWTLISIAAIAAIFSGYSGQNSDYPSGAPAGYTGSPGDGQNCVACHGGSASNVTGWITSDIPSSGYIAGTTYNITVTVTGTGAKGFEVSPQNPSGTLLGTLIAGTGNSLVGNGKYVTHTSSSNSNPKVWTFQWVAPATGTGTVTFYGAFVVTKPVTKLSTLVVNENIPMTANATATPSALVTGETSQLDVTVTGGTGSNTYAWTSVPPGFTSSLKNPVASPTVTTTYNVTVTSGSQTANSSATVTVYQTLTAQASATPSTITAGESSQLDVTVTGGTGTNTYAWTSTPAGFTSSLKNPVVTPSETTVYSVTVTSGTQTANSTTTVTVNPLIPLAVQATATPSSILPGESSQLNALASGGSGTYSYSWTSIPPGFTSNIQNPVVTPAATTQYVVVVGDGAGTTSDTVEVTVTLNPLEAQATATPSTICVGQTSQLNVTATGGSGTYTYSWASVPPGFTSNLQNPVVTPTENTQYIADVTDGSQNASSSTNVTVIPEPTAFAGNDTSYCYTITQFPVSGTAVNYSSVLWSTSGDGTFGDATLLSTDYFPGAGDIAAMAVNLTLTVDPVSPCAAPVSSVRHIVFDPCLGIPGAQGGGFTVSVSPNPSTGVIHVAIRGTSAKESLVTVMDLSGNTIATRVTAIPGDAFETFDLSSLARGLYVLRVQAGADQVIRKIVIQ